MKREEVVNTLVANLVAQGFANNEVEATELANTLFPEKAKVDYEEALLNTLTNNGSGELTREVIDAEQFMPKHQALAALRNLANAGKVVAHKSAPTGKPGKPSFVKWTLPVAVVDEQSADEVLVVDEQ